MIPIPSYHDIIDLVKKGATIEAQEKIMELREAALTIQEENLELRKRVGKLENRIGLTEAMEFRKPFYFRTGDANAHCPVCWEKDKLAIHLKGPEGPAEWYRCPVCKWHHNVKPDTAEHVSMFTRDDRFSGLL